MCVYIYIYICVLSLCFHNIRVHSSPISCSNSYSASRKDFFRVSTLILSFRLLTYLSISRWGFKLRMLGFGVGNILSICTAVAINIQLDAKCTDSKSKSWTASDSELRPHSRHSLSTNGRVNTVGPRAPLHQAVSKNPEPRKVPKCRPFWGRDHVCSRLASAPGTRFQVD